MGGCYAGRPSGRYRTKNPVVQEGLPFIGYNASLFNGQGADTFGSIYCPIGPDASYWTGINTTVTGTAEVTGIRRINRKGQIGQDLSQEEIRTGPLDD